MTHSHHGAYNPKRIPGTAFADPTCEKPAALVLCTNVIGKILVLLSYG